MSDIRFLDLYAGLGGNRKLLKGVQVTAVELDPKIAAVYQKLYPEDTVIVGDAHQYLLEHYEEFDFIWSSPPCQSHSSMVHAGRNRTPRYADMDLYQQVIFLKTYFKGHWVVENVRPYYDALIAFQSIGRHCFWSNYQIPAMRDFKFKNFMYDNGPDGNKALMEWLGIHYEGRLYYGDNHCYNQVLRNCVHPEIGLAIFEARSEMKGDLFG